MTQPPDPVAGVLLPPPRSTPDPTGAGGTGAESTSPRGEAAAADTATEDAGHEQAAAEAVAAAAAPAAAAATTPDNVPPHHPPGQPGKPALRRSEAGWKVRRHRRLPRLRIGTHTAAPVDLDRLQVTSAAFGLLIGRDQAGNPVALPLFQPAPTRVTLIGGAWATRLLVFRALAFGARVAVFSTDAADWLRLGRRATARHDRITVRRPGDPPSVQGSADAPLLLLSTLDAADAEGDPPGGALSAWTTALTVLPQLPPARVAHIHQAELVLTQRLAPEEADRLSDVCRLPVATGHALQVLHDDMLAVLSPGRTRYAWVNQSTEESVVLGPPGRA